ncbi:hypothetical protein GCK32_014117 [Trichostrongylus colubriformis]|uniref:Uncharacterized protein n=1 Tax=Trichostrongylus colubriformis TaxID=6319 RepID=A0AAN8FM02_TRICO
MEYIQKIPSAPNRRKYPTRVCICSDDPQLQESPSELDRDPNDEPLYEDKFCKITAKDILVKWYYFPCGSSARIPLQNVSAMWIQPIDDRFPSTQWGSTDEKIWWAFDSRRDGTKSTSGVVILEPTRPQLIGFSVRKRQRFQSVLQAVARFPIHFTLPTNYC